MFVTVTGRGSMSFSEDAWELLGTPQAVRFLFGPGPQAHMVGFEACGKGESSSHAAWGTGRTVRAGLLLKVLGYSAGETRRYTLRVEEGMPPYIDLNEDVPAIAARGASHDRP